MSQGQDSLIFDNHNDIIYSTDPAGAVGEVRRVDPAVGISSDTLLAKVGYGNGDLALVPGGNFVLVVSRATGQIFEVNLNHPGQTPTIVRKRPVLRTASFTTRSGRLFAVSNSNNVESIVELDPTTFNVIASSGPLQGLDGLSFDSFTGDLFVRLRPGFNSVSGRAGFYEVSLQPGSFLQAKLITSSAFPAGFGPDGLEPDGEGNLYVASYLE